MISKRLVYKVNPLTELETIPVNENGDLEIVDDYHLCNIIVINCCRSFSYLSIFTLIIILILYTALFSEWVELISDPTASIINYVLDLQVIKTGRDISGINVACYVGGICSCTSTVNTSPQLSQIRPTLN